MNSFKNACFSIIMLTLSLSGALWAQTDTIHITFDAVWSGDTVDIEKHIAIDSGVTLTISAGSYIRFMGHYALIVYGSLRAIGTPSDSIIFAPADTTAGWSGIRFTGTSSIQDSSTLDYCTFLYGNATGTGDNGNGGALFLKNYENVSVHHSLFIHNRAYNGGAVYSGIGCRITLTECAVKKNRTGSSGGCGGGIYSAGTCVISKCLIDSNTTGKGADRDDNQSWAKAGKGGSGGGLYSTGTAFITECAVTTNSTGYGGVGMGTTNVGGDGGDGGGVYSGGNMEMEQCSVSCNRSGNGGAETSNGRPGDGGKGGGLYATGNTRLTNCTFEKNRTGNGGTGNGSYGNGGDGGGVFAAVQSNALTMERCVIANNSAGYGNSIPGGTVGNIAGNGGNGGGLYLNGYAYMRFCRFVSNSAGNGGNGLGTYSDGGNGGNGGGLCASSLFASLPPVSYINNSSFERNFSGAGGTGNSQSGAHGNGGGLYVMKNGAARATLSNNTIVKNTSYTSSGGLYTDCKVTNSIIWGNIPGQAYCTDSLTFSAVMNGYAGVKSLGNISAYPQFNDSANNDWSLRSNSPCINAGTPDTSGLALPQTDLAGNPRIFDGIIDRIDMGAYEFQGNPPVLVKAGDITVDETWYTDTVKVVGNITVKKGVTLTVNPGVYVQFQGNFKLTIEGRLLAAGTAADTIIFTINDTTGFGNPAVYAGGWGGMRFLVSDTATDFSAMSYCRLEYGKNTFSAGDTAGGAVTVRRKTKLLINYCEFANNYSLNGGAIAVFDSTRPNIINNVIRHNTARIDGGGIVCRTSAPYIGNNILRGNKCSRDGAGIYIWKAQPVIAGNVLYANTADTGNGGGFYCDDNARPLIINNTVVMNSARAGTGMYAGISCIPVVMNSIFWCYSDPNNIFSFTMGSKDTITYCAVQGGHSGAGNIDAYPLFIDTVAGNWNIARQSPCVDGGNPDTAGLHLPQYDITGGARVDGLCIDIGAYEIQSLIADLRIAEDSPEFSHTDLTKAFAGFFPQTTPVFSILSNSNPAVVSVSINPANRLLVRGIADAFGQAAVVVQATDNRRLTVYDTFTIVVTPINDAPSFVKGANQETVEDTGPQTVAGWASQISPGPANESDQQVQFIVTNTNHALFTQQPSVSPGGTLAYTPAPDSSGAAVIAVTLKDNGGTAGGGVDSAATAVCTLTVTFVNDAPSFTKGADVAVIEDCGAHTAANWASAVIPGPANESGQALSFTVSTNNPTLFSQSPSIAAATGALTFTPAGDANGAAAVSIVLKDDGGTANGGMDSSAAQSFTITVNPVNDAPIITPVSDTTIKANALFERQMFAHDVDDSAQSIKWYLASSPNTMVIAENTGTINWTPTNQDSGLHTITLFVRDPAGASDTTGFKIRVDYQTGIVIADSGPCKKSLFVTAAPNPAGAEKDIVGFYYSDAEYGCIAHIVIFDALGNSIYSNSFNIQPQHSGRKSIKFAGWDLTNKQGKKVESGTYLAVIKTRDRSGKTELFKLLIGVKK